MVRTGGTLSLRCAYWGGAPGGSLRSAADGKCVTVPERLVVVMETSGSRYPGRRLCSKLLSLGRPRQPVGDSRWVGPGLG